MPPSVCNLIARCTCAPTPWTNGPQGVELSGVYAALPASVTEVEVQIPGFPTITVPVTRG